jgi:peroxiredoxin
MNKLKSLFITLYITHVVLVLVLACFQLSTGADSGIWLAILVAAGSVAYYFGRLYLSHVPRTSQGLMGFTFGIFGATLYSLYASYNLGVASPAPLLALLVLVGWVTYVGWYSHLGDRTKDKVKVGKKLFELKLEDTSGKPVSSKDWEGEKSLVLFYRGNWCPICSAQIQELFDAKEKFDELNVKMRFISSQPHVKSERFAKRMGLGVEFLVDSGNKAAQQLNIVHEDGLPLGLQLFGHKTDMAKPTLFVTDENGKVVYADLTDNYRLRPEVSDILNAIR